MTTELIIIWFIGSLLITALVCALAKNYGPEFLTAMFVGGLIVAGSVVAKFVEIGPFVTSAGLLAFSVTFLVTDTISEFWGKKKAQRVVLSGFAVYLMFIFTTQVAVFLQAPSFWTGQEAFELVFGSSWRVALASLAAYIIAQTFDVHAFHFIKKVTKGKHLWLRNTLSTGSSQTIDTLVFFTIAFYGVVPLTEVIISTILLKIIIAVLDTPFIYLIRWYYENFKPYKKRIPATRFGNRPIV